MTSFNSSLADEEDDFVPLDASEEDDFVPIAPKKDMSIEAQTERLPSVSESLNFDKIFSYPNVDYAGLKKGLSSGLTLGLSNLIPEVAPEPRGPNYEKWKEASEFAGSLLPIHKLFTLFEAPLVKLATKSPIFQRQLTSLARITGSALTGASYEGLKEVAQGKMPSAEDMLEHGAEWGVIDAGLQALGLGGKFAASLFKRAEAEGKPTFQVLNDTINEMRAQGVDFTQSDKVAAKAMSILEREPGTTTRELSMPEATPASKMEKVAQERIQAESAQVATDLQSKKIEAKTFDRIDKEAPALSEPYKPSELKAEEVMQDINKSEVDQKIAGIAERAATERQLGENIQNSVLQEKQAAESIYRPLYQQAEQEATGIAYAPRRSANVAVETLRRIENLRTRPTGYGNVIRTLETALDDLGYQLQRAPNGRIEDVILRDTGSRLNELMELGRRVNEIIDYDVLDPTIKDRLRPLARTIKSEIREALEARPNGLAAFNQAEAFYGETAEKMGRDSIKAIRGEESLETIAKSIRSPTVLRDLRPILPSAQMKQIEREIVEHINTLSHENGKKLLKELGPELSAESRRVAQDVVDSKLPLGKKQQVIKIQKAVFNDLGKAIATGARPERALKLWKTTEGQKLIRDGLRSSPNRREILNYLREQSFYDFANSVVDKQGVINFKKLGEFLKDPATIENLRLVGGEDAVKFFRELEGMAEQLKHNMSLIEKIPNVEKLQKAASRGKELIKRTQEKNLLVPKEKAVGQEKIREEVARRAESTKEMGKKKLKEMARKQEPGIIVKEFIENLGVPTKTILGLIGFYTLGALKLSGALGLKYLYRVAMRQRSRAAFKNLVKQSKHSPEKFFAAFEAFDREMQED